MRWGVLTSIRALWKMLVTARPSLSVISLKFALLVSKASVTPSWVKGCTRLVSKLAEKLGKEGVKGHRIDNIRRLTLGGSDV